jgi:transcriptional repressor NrdR
MKCPYCGTNDDRVVDSRESREGDTIRRRRECQRCARRFTSYEQLEDLRYRVVKRDGRREEFLPGKLLGGLAKACEKRPIPTARLEEIVAAVERTLQAREEREISTAEIGTLVMDALRDIDPVAYLRFASVYRRFEDLGSFVAEVQSLLERSEAARQAAKARPATGPRRSARAPRPSAPRPPA